MPQLGIVSKDYLRVYESPIALRQGDQVTITKQDLWDGQHVWLWSINAAGKEGWVPAAFLDVQGDVGTALRDYDAIELSVASGERLSLLEEAGGWYWAENSLGQAGWVPVSHVTVAVS